ncbi:LEA domain protein [Stachybotrys elegans]|uniref:LEA domain protein n=1 Tax=Stachybotrys elegans TaxID=80388 RepID=A0A8K0SWQ0_9HYPO|nr:LEA domain protein [Stachybotrys elegans]
MYQDISKPPAPLPSAKIEILKPGFSLQPPLTRRGSGPGLIILTTQDEYDEAVVNRDDAPTAVLKWAEEGYTVVQISAEALGSPNAETVVAEALDALNKSETCQPKDKVGLVCYSSALWNTTIPILESFPAIAAAIVYVDSASDLAEAKVPSIRHIAGPPKQPGLKVGAVKEYYYPTVKTNRWFSAGHGDFDYSSDSVAHTRNLQFLKPKMNGPYFDLESIWEEHTYYEFADRSVEHTMSTMVQEPYVNHVPTLTGGIGRVKLSDFYRHNFIFNNSADTDLELVSRTIGIDRVVDEFVFKFTHDREIDWLLYHEHISWDQGTTLRQLGLLPEYLPFPHPLPDSSSIPKDAEVEYQVPVLGVETADKLRNRKAIPSNQMFTYSVREKKV